MIGVAGLTLTRSQAPTPRVVLRHGRLVLARSPTGTPAAEPAPPIAAQAPEQATVGAGRTTAILLFVAALFLPTLYALGPLNLSPALLYLIVAFVPLLGIWASGRAGRRIPSDFLVLAFALWAAASRFLLLPAGTAIEPAGVILLQSAGGYLAGRVLVRDLATTRLAIGAAIGGVALMLPFLLWESATGAKPLLDMARLFGTTLMPTEMEPRWGFRRAQGVFEHPILLGIFCATLLSAALFLFAGPRGRAMRWVAGPAMGLAAMTSLSTGALLSMNVQFGLMLWNRLLRNVTRRWAILTWLVAALYLSVDLLSSRTPFHVFVDYATFNSQSSYNRILIWEFGSAAVMNSPLLGHGTDDWERPAYMHASMDNFWLVIAYRYGLTGVALLLGGFLTVLISIGRQPEGDAQATAMRRGMIFALVATMIAVVSVHLWNNSYIWLMFMLGAAGWMTLPAEMPVPPDSTPPPAQSRRARLQRLGF